MPSKSPEQASLMRAVAHGWKMPGGGGPSQAVAREFVDADKRMYSGGFAESSYAGGGSVEMRMGGLLQEALRKLPEGHELRIRFGIDKPGRTTLTGQTSGGDGEAEKPAGYEPPPRIFVPPGKVPGRFTSTPVERRDRPAGRDTEYSKKLREHRRRVAASLGVPSGYAGGGAVKGYAEGGTARGDNPYPRGSARWRLWERKYGRDPNEPDETYAPAPPPPAPPPPELSFLQRLLGGGAEQERQTRSERELEALGEARGGYQKFQAGGLAQAMGGKMMPPGGPRRPMRRPAPMPRRSAPVEMSGTMAGMPIAPPPGKVPGGGRLPMQPRQRGMGMPIQGGARTPPNMRGYMQRMQMANRPGASGARGSGNRVGMRDQQGGLARALQRGTGRPPMSRRSAFPR